MLEEPTETAPPASFPPLEEVTAEPITTPITLLTVVLALVSILVAAGLVGGAWHFVSYLMDIPIVFPIFVGCGAGWMVCSTMKWSKVRNAKWVMGFALAAALGSALSRQIWDAYSERPQIVTALTRQASPRYPSIPLPQLRRAVDKRLNAWETLRIHLQVRAEMGTELVTTREQMSNAKGVPVKGGFYWVLLVVDAAVAGFAGALIGELFSQSRYCPECGKSFRSNLLFSRKDSQIDTMLALTRAQDWNSLKLLPRERNMGKSRSSVTLLQCEGGCPQTVVVEQASEGAPRKRLLNAWISPESAEAARAASLAEVL